MVFLTNKTYAVYVLQNSRNSKSLFFPRVSCYIVQQKRQVFIFFTNKTIMHFLSARQNLEYQGDVFHFLATQKHHSVTTFSSNNTMMHSHTF